MAAPQDVYSFAWALEIKSSPVIRCGSRDLPDDAAVTTLGGFFTRRLKHIDEARLVQQTSNLFYGIDTGQGIQFTIDNADALLSQSLEWRRVPVVLYHYDLINNVKVTDFVGIITQAEFINTECILSIAAHDYGILETLLPAAVIDPALGSPFELSGAAGVAPPVVFGDSVPVRPPSAAADVIADPGGFDYLIGYDWLFVRAVYQDIDTDIAGLERLGTWVAAPGSPAYLNATTFTVTGDQSVRYAAGTHIRYITTAGGIVFQYGNVKTYSTAFSPHRVTLDALDPDFDSGLTNVQIAGDYLLLRAYTGITDGLLPQPGAPGADFTAIRMFDQGDASLLVIADSRDFPAATTHITDVIEEIITNDVWGLSTHITQTVNTGAFAVVKVYLGLQGWVGAVNGALGYDQQQRRAGDVLSELCMLRGIQLFVNENGAWDIRIDTLPAGAVKEFVLGSGDSPGIKIMRLLSHGRLPIGQAVRSVTLHWNCLGRAKAANQKFTPREYAQKSYKSLATTGSPTIAVGQDMAIFSQWIRSDTIAELATHYLAEKFRGADERIEFTTGVEARDVFLGEKITVTVPSDGISGQWQVYGISKTLTEVTLACFKENDAAYSAASGVVTSESPSADELDRRTSTGSGSNLILNPDFSPPITTLNEPHGWHGGGTGLTLTFDDSAAIQPDTYGGHYATMVTALNSTPQTHAAGVFEPGLTTKPLFACPALTLLMFSFYCDQTQGIYATAYYYAGGYIPKLLQVISDPTDRNPAGWGRMYARLRSPASVTHIQLGIHPHAAGTYRIDAVQLEPVNGTARKPSGWKRHRPQPITQLAAAEITLTGSLTAPNLIPAGVKVVGVTARITQAIVFGTATKWDIGTVADPTAWSVNNQTTMTTGLTITALNATTSAANFFNQSEIYFPTNTSVIITLNGTVTAGKVNLVVEYTRPAPPSGP
jgi:hypothetical protein